MYPSVYDRWKRRHGRSGMVTPEQRDLVDAVHGLLGKRADSAAIRRAHGLDATLWRTLTEQIGFAGLPIAEEHGGAGASIVESALVLEALGYHLAPLPALSSLIAASATDDPQLLTRIAAGEICAVVTHPTSPVLDAPDATLILALTDDGTVLHEGATATPETPMDPTLRLGTIDLTTATRTPVAGDPARGHRAALIGLSALAAGCARRGLDMTVAYSKQREQFGRPIGSFQALKHRMADMLVLVESTTSAARAAATGDLDPTVAAAYAKEALAQIAGETIQLHGGIAITWEHDAHLVFKRAHALGQLFGQAHELRRGLLR